MPSWLEAALAKARPITNAVEAHASILRDAIVAGAARDYPRVLEDLVEFGVDVYEAVHANTGTAS